MSLNIKSNPLILYNFPTINSTLSSAVLSSSSYSSFEFISDIGTDSILVSDIILVGLDIGFLMSLNFIVLLLSLSNKYIISDKCFWSEIIRDG